MVKALKTHESVESKLRKEIHHAPVYGGCESWKTRGRDCVGDVSYGFEGSWQLRGRLV